MISRKLNILKNKISRFIQKIRCSIPFNLTYFGHKKTISIKQLSQHVQLIKCLDCNKLFAINHDLQVVLPWEDVKSFYEEFDQIIDMRKSIITDALR